MKVLLVVLFSALTSMSAFAISQEKLLKKCAPVAQEKMDAHALKLSCVPTTNNISVLLIDNRTMNPYKYVKWEMKVDCEDKSITEITAITQYVSYEKTCI